jgi:hypothetical protein
MKLDSKNINEKARTNYAIFSGFLNVEEEAWRSAVLESALESLGIDPIKLWEEYPQEYCCGKIDGVTPDHSDELSCECCNGSCVWCND